MFTSIRKQLLSILLLFGFVNIIVSIVIFAYYEKNKRSLSAITTQVEKTHLLLVQDLNVMHEFFENETINPRFFESGESTLIKKHNRICSEIKKEFMSLYDKQEEFKFTLTSRLSAIEQDFKKYKVLSSEMLREILKRGFKDYGIEGKMRDYAHTLETYENAIGLNNVLQLRRHEKDFILRQEDPYIYKFEALTDKIITEVLANTKIELTEKNEIIEIIREYSTEFKNLVLYDKKLGLKTGSGLKREIDLISAKIESSLAETVLLSEHEEGVAIRNVKYVYLIIGLVFGLIAVLFALIISKRVSKSITNLKEKIDEFVKSDFTVRTVLPITRSVNEIDVLTANFSIMEQYIVDQMKSLRQSNKDLEMLFHITSNDIKPPLLKVKELTTQAFVRTTDKDIRESFYQISLSWDKLLNIADELGIVTNIRTTEIKTELINLDTVINSIFSEFRLRAENIIFSTDINIANEFFSSSILVKAIFRNLVDNGVKYASQREGTSYLKIIISDQNDEMLKIEVTDNGIGIKKEHLDNIFNMFFRATTKATGTGLGLYVVKCSVEKLHGAISVESTEDTGTTFTLLLPNNYRRKNIREKIIHNREILKLAVNDSNN